ncbi:MAG TPA: hypothetical protein ENH15_04535 [Actinobacteria bacterium]|nr:hypothetical protein [Actinomycetota bacterium]
MDPAIVDRRTTHLPGVDEAGLPVRTMSIAGLEGRLATRVLSKDMSGPATRIAKFEGSWGSGATGAFTADVSVLVLNGRLRIGAQSIGQYDFAHIPQRCMVPGIRAEDGTMALLLTTAPFSYDTTSGGMAGAVEIVRATEIPWEAQPCQEGRFVKRLASTRQGDSWLSGSVDWSGDDGPWHRHAVAEEMVLLDGELTISELDGRGPQTHTYLPGGYVWRPAGILHAGPGSSAEGKAIAFHHTSGVLETEWVDEQSMPVPSTDQGQNEPDSHAES